MPYKIKKSGSGFKVCKKTGKKCFSKKSLSKKKARAQMYAIQLNSENYFENLIEHVINE